MAAGKSVMLWQGDTGAATVLAANPEIRLGMFFPPGRTAALTRATLFPADTLTVNSKASNMVAARAFVDFAALEEQSRLFARTSGSQAPSDYQRVLDPAVGAKALDAVHQFAVPYARSKRLVVTGQAEWPTVAPFVALGTGVQGLLTGQRTVRQVLRAADAAWRPKR
jgi:raffinose/stachyose/melibiose transport system substrate-binding protein